MKPTGLVCKLLVQVMALLIASVSFSQDFTLKPEHAEALANEMQESIKNGATLIFEEKLQLVLEKAPYVATETHTDWSIDYNENGAVLKLSYDEKSYKNPRHFLKDVAILTAIGRSKSKNHLGKAFADKIFTGSPPHEMSNVARISHDLIEIISNVKQGSPIALAHWNKIQLSVLKSLSITSKSAEALGIPINILIELSRPLESQQAELDLNAKKYLSRQKKSLQQWRSQTQALEKMEGMANKLNDLVLANDRKGVRALLNTYLPWAVMEPVEAQMWKTWLEAIENPKKENSIVAFRGVAYSTDKVQRKNTANGEVYGFFSTVLTKNQGSYTRRLRSLSTNRLKNGDDRGGEIPSVRMARQMIGHSDEPQASNFLSFTYRPEKAQDFAATRGGLLTVQMDSRRLFANLSSEYPHEVELLAPLVIFPDEVLIYHEGELSDEKLNEIVDRISAKTGQDFIDLDKLEEKYEQDGYKYLKDTVIKSAYSCSRVF